MLFFQPNPNISPRHDCPVSLPSVSTLGKSLKSLAANADSPLSATVHLPSLLHAGQGRPVGAAAGRGSDDVPCRWAEPGCCRRCDRVYEVSQVNLVRLPSHVLRGLTEAVLRTQQTSQQVSEPIRGEGLSTLNKFDVVCPQHLSDLMKMDNRWSASLSREQKCLVLDYLCCHGDPFLLEDLELLPLADGTFSACSDHVVHVCRGQQDLDLLPGLHDSLCFVTHPEGLHGRLQRLAESGNLNVVGTRLFSLSTTFVAFVIVAPPVMFAALAKCNLSSQAHLYSINGKCACHMWKQKWNWRYTTNG